MFGAWDFENAGVVFFGKNILGVNGKEHNMLASEIQRYSKRM
jgi:hypothetical protein